MLSFLHDILPSNLDLCQIGNVASLHQAASSLSCQLQKASPLPQSDLARAFLLEWYRVAYWLAVQSVLSSANRSEEEEEEEKVFVTAFGLLILAHSSCQHTMSTLTDYLVIYFILSIN